MKLALDHVALPAFDAAATVRFYAEILELPLIDALSGDSWGGRPWLMMVFGLAEGGSIVLCALRGAERPRPDDLPRDVRHCAIAAGSPAELEAWKTRLRAAAVSYDEEDHGAQRSLYFEDPNGNLLEITAPASRVPADAAANPSASQLVNTWLQAG